MKVAIVTQGYLAGGGVPSVVDWLRRGLVGRGVGVDVHDLAASRRDALSRRVLAPGSWRSSAGSSVDDADPHLYHWGGNWVEFESQRYRPRRELTNTLNSYDLIQIVAGAPSVAKAVRNARPVKILQVATTLAAERRSQFRDMSLGRHMLKRLTLPGLVRAERDALRVVDHVMVENRWMEAWVLGSGQQNVTLAPPGIDTELFAPAGPWDPCRPIVAFGRLCDARKDWPTAVDAYDRFIARTGAGNRLLLAGRGPLTETLAKRVDGSPFKHRIDVEVDLPADQVPSLLAKGSVFLQSSMEEGLGLAGLEAMACGLPVVATRTAGSAEYVVNGRNGYLVDIDSDASRRLAEILEAVLCSGRGEAMSIAARRDCDELYGAAVTFDRFIKVYAKFSSNTPRIGERS